MIPWYVFKERTGLELALAAKMQGIDIEVWCPLCRWKTKARHRRNGWVHHECALLPGYLFAQVPDDAWPRIFDLHPKPEPFRDPWGNPQPVLRIHELADLLHREETGEFDRTGEDVIPHQVNAGDVLKLAFGTFADWEVKVVEVTGGDVIATAVLFGAERNIRVQPNRAVPLP